MKFQLRPYQFNSIDKIRESIKSGKKRPILGLPTGGGKTVTFTFLIESALLKGSRVGIVCHRTELIDQARETIKAYGIDPSLVHFGMVQTYVRSPHKIPSLDLCVIDECFVSGTMIDDVPIENIKIGDYVNSYNHKKRRLEKRKVLDIMKRPIKSHLVKINFPCVSFVCTPNHPIFVIDKGYVQANKLKKNDRVVSLPTMWKGNEKRGLQDKYLEVETKQEKERCEEFLSSSMRSELLRFNAFKKNVRKQPYQIRRGKKKNISNFEKDKTQAYNTRRERKRSNKTTKKIIRQPRRFFFPRVSCCNRIRIPSISLQNRYSKSREKNSYRNRRVFSLLFKKERTRQKERGVLKIERVESVKVLERQSNERIGDGFVYNLQVDGNENYFANGVLVHNCHIGNFRRFIDLLPANTQIIGVTATPIGSSNKNPLNQVFDDVVYPVQINELIQQGFLSKPIYHIWKCDESKLKKDFKGEFTSQSQNEVFHLDDLLEAVKRRVGKTIIFCSSIKQIEDVYNKIKDSEETYFVHSKMESNHRKSIVLRFKSSRNSIIINCGILTAGFDDPSIETVIVYRATTSIALWLQMVGRGSRIAEGKDTFYIFDLGGNHGRLLPWEANRDWKAIFELQGKKLKDKEAPLKKCVECEAVIYASQTICPYCQSEQPTKTKEELKATEVQIINSFHDLPANLQKPYDQMTVKELLDRAAYGSPDLGRPFKQGWVLAQIKQRPNRVELIKELAKIKGYKQGWIRRNL